MASPPFELDNSNSANQARNAYLQQEAETLRMPQKHDGVVGTVENALAEVPAPVMAAVGVTAGTLARMPGTAGIVGKVAAAGFGLAYGGDLVLRASGAGSSHAGSGSIWNDSLALGSLGAGILTGKFLLHDSLPFARTPVLESAADKIAFTHAVPAWAEGTSYPGVRQEFLKSLDGFHPAEQAKIKDALAVAEDAHYGQFRMLHTDSPIREPFIIHPVRVATILTKEAGVRDADTVTASLLHDVVEDSKGKYTSEHIATRFGPRVGSIVDTVTKPEGELPNGRLSPEQLATYYANIEAAPGAVRDVKLADRLDNMRDTFTLPNPRFQQRYLTETLDHYLPMAQFTRPFFVDQLTETTRRLSQILNSA